MLRFIDVIVTTFSYIAKGLNAKGEFFSLAHSATSEFIRMFIQYSKIHY